MLGMSPLLRGRGLGEGKICECEPDKLKIYSPAFPHDDASRAALVFAGDLVIYRQVPALQSFVALAAARLRDALDGLDPQRAHKTLAAEDYDQRIGDLRAMWRVDNVVLRAWTDIFHEVGLRLDTACYDWFYIRALPPGRSHLGRHTPLLPAHRDTWGSNVYQQINWWAPVFPLAPTSTFVVYPDYWDPPVSNTSAAWDLAALRQLPSGQRKDYPKLPDILETPDNSVPVMLEPGDILAFSAQHLHASQLNTTTEARLNLECRTVCVDDIASQRATPNIDGAAPHIARDWFKRITDGTPLPQLMNKRV